MSNVIVNPYSFVTGGDPQITNIFNEAVYTWETDAGASGCSIESGDDPSGNGESAGSVGSPYWRRGKTTIESFNSKTFVWKFTWAREGADEANNSILTLANFEWADTNTPPTDKKQIKFQCQNGTQAYFRAQTSTASNTSTIDGSFLQGAGTTRYYTVTGNGSQWKAQSWSDSDRTTDEITTSDLGFPADWLDADAIDNVTFGSFGTDSSDFIVSSVSVSYDGGE